MSRDFILDDKKMQRIFYFEQQNIIARLHRITINYHNYLAKTPVWPIASQKNMTVQKKKKKELLFKRLEVKNLSLDIVICKIDI